MKTRSVRRARGLTWEQFCAKAALLPGVTSGTSYGTPALHVCKKFLARLKEDGDSVAIRLDFADREVLLEAEPRAFYLTDHYRPYPAVLMRLSQVSEGIAVELLAQAWRCAAPRRLVLAHAAPQAVEARQPSKPPRATATRRPRTGRRTRP